MVDFIILNTNSLPFENRDSFRVNFKEILSIIKFLKEEKKYYNSIRTTVNISEIQIIEGEYLQKFIKSESDRDFKSMIISFFANGVVEYPINEDSEDENLGLLEYKFNEETMTEMGYADIFNTLLISFNSSEIWNDSILKLNKIKLNNECYVEEAVVEIVHASKRVHLERHSDFFEQVEHEKLLEIQIDFKTNKQKYFSRIEFCEEIDKNIDKIDKNILNDSIKIFYYLEIKKRNLNDYDYSDESDGVKHNPRLKEMRRFTLPSGEKKYMFKHIKNLAHGNRIYFYLDEVNDKIYIGYIGPHLKTVKH